MAKSKKTEPNLRAATVARVNQLVKGGLTKAGAFEKISSETGRARDAVQMLYYRAMRAAKAGPKGSRPPAGAVAARKSGKGAASARPSSSKSAGRSSRSGPGASLPALLNGIASAINELLKHVEKTAEENKSLKQQAARLQAITSLVRGN